MTQVHHTFAVHSYAFFRDGAWCSSESSSYDIPPRLHRKLDAMSQLALTGVHHMAPRFSQWEARRIGLCFANRVGGWGFGEPQMQQLHRTHASGMTSPYLGSAWFPAAMQGEISLTLPCHGHSKTFVGDGRAFWHALAYAQLLLALRKLDAVVVGAVEAITTPVITQHVCTTRMAAGCMLLTRHDNASRAASAPLAIIASDDPHRTRTGFHIPQHAPFPVDAALGWLAPLHHAIITAQPCTHVLPITQLRQAWICTTHTNERGSHYAVTTARP